MLSNIPAEYTTFHTEYQVQINTILWIFYEFSDKKVEEVINLTNENGNLLFNLAATFSPDLVDFSIYIIDVAQGEKIPRKAGQGMIKSDLFIINKIDLAPHVGADLEVMKKVFGDNNVFTAKIRATGTCGYKL